MGISSDSSKELTDLKGIRMELTAKKGSLRASSNSV